MRRLVTMMRLPPGAERARFLLSPFGHGREALSLNPPQAGTALRALVPARFNLSPSETASDRSPQAEPSLCAGMVCADHEQTVASSPGKGADGKPADPEKQGDLAVAERPKTQKPRRYQVVLHNDDFTTMEFVVHVLIKFFHKSETEATQIMLHVHHKGFGVVGLFTRDVAESKAEQVMRYARENGHPLKCTAEPEGLA